MDAVSPSGEPREWLTEAVSPSGEPREGRMEAVSPSGGASGGEDGEKCRRRGEERRAVEIRRWERGLVMVMGHSPAGKTRGGGD